MLGSLWRHAPRRPLFAAVLMLAVLLGSGCPDLGDKVLTLDGGDGDSGGGPPDVRGPSDARPADPGTADLAGGGGDTGAPDAAPDLPPSGPSFATEVQPIFNTACATPNCHVMGSVTVDGLFLSQGVAYGQIVGVPSIGRPQMMRIAPGNADASYLYIKVTASTGDPRIVGAPMPLQRPPLAASDIATLRDWINAGALDN
jgi:hypothetical protein